MSDRINTNNARGVIAQTDTWTPDTDLVATAEERRRQADNPTAPLLPSNRGNRTVFFGDSITFGNSPGGTDPANGYAGRTSYALWASIRSGGRIRPMVNAGVSGNRTSQMLARLQSDVIAQRPARCVILGGTNDVSFIEPLATTQANLTAIVDILLGAGITPILCTIPPRGDTANTTTQRLIRQINAWLAWFCDRHGLALFDLHAVVADPAGDGWRNAATWTPEGIHPTEAAALAIGDAFATAIGPTFPVWQPYLTHQKGDPINLLANGVFVGDSDSNGAADSWSLFGAGGTATVSLDTSDTAIVGNWQKIDVTVAPGAGNYRQVAQTITMAGKFAVGDRIAFCGRVSMANIANGGSVNIDLKFTAGQAPASIRPLNAVTVGTSGVFYQEGIVPVGTTGITVSATLLVGTGTLKVAQMTVLNLTQLGLV